ncbi:MAG: type II toxin-antitoxin system VapC family toxin [Verrucomicrobia bacterium]|nr:MAG: type II toxin-antitoxin system VapC family toxin [Verrucomicrobiota bacterium]TAE87262.1 MAG: type II toxin-antitoxin system VapC family toxin [Verrucomicrobiota bacterium]TAF25097.1 MAG: type II toxin-antitoxin system VapC family toxin [Verrucomicrobiota bacterium]
MPYLLDTVTLSAFRRPDKAGPNLIRWQAAQRGTIGCVSVVTLNELRYGMRKVEERDPVFAAHLATWYSQIVSHPDQFRILSVDRAIAELAADFRADHNTPFEDSLIAATAKVHKLTLATRNTADFEGCGIDILNPWEFDS